MITGRFCWNLPTNAAGITWITGILIPASEFTNSAVHLSPDGQPAVGALAGHRHPTESYREISSLAGNP